jgi:hypothetical protein
MTIASRIKAAFLGIKEERSILIRDGALGCCNLLSG